jgi:hypothetical protein
MLARDDRSRQRPRESRSGAVATRGHATCLVVAVDRAVPDLCAAAELSGLIHSSLILMHRWPAAIAKITLLTDKISRRQPDEFT